MLCAGGNQVDACGFDTAVTQQVSQFGNVPAGTVENRGKQVPQIMWKHFSRLHTCVLAQPFQFRPDLSAAEFLSAFGAKVNCPKLCGQYKKEPLVGNIEF